MPSYKFNINESENFLLNQLKNVVHPYSYDLSNFFFFWNEVPCGALRRGKNVRSVKKKRKILYHLIITPSGGQKWDHLIIITTLNAWRLYTMYAYSLQHTNIYTHTHQRFMI